MEPPEAPGAVVPRVAGPWRAAVAGAVMEGKSVMGTLVRQGATQLVRFRTEGVESTGPSFPISMMPEPMSA